MSEITIASKNNEAYEKFLEGIKEKVRSGIAEMMPDEVITEMAQQVIKEEFLTSTPIKDRYGEIVGHEPSKFQKAVIEAATPLMENYIKNFFNENPTKIQETVLEILEESFQRLILTSISNCVVKYICQNPYEFKDMIQRAL